MLSARGFNVWLTDDNGAVVVEHPVTTRAVRANQDSTGNLISEHTLVNGPVKRSIQATTYRINVSSTIPTSAHGTDDARKKEIVSIVAQAQTGNRPYRRIAYGDWTNDVKTPDFLKYDECTYKGHAVDGVLIPEVEEGHLPGDTLLTFRIKLDFSYVGVEGLRPDNSRLFATFKFTFPVTATPPPSGPQSAEPTTCRQNQGLNDSSGPVQREKPGLVTRSRENERVVEGNLKRCEKPYVEQVHAATRRSTSDTATPVLLTKSLSQMPDVIQVTEKHTRNTGDSDKQPPQSLRLTLPARAQASGSGLPADMNREQPNKQSNNGAYSDLDIAGANKIMEEYRKMEQEKADLKEELRKLARARQDELQAGKQENSELREAIKAMKKGSRV
ncbi:hypothetical protein EIP91_011008 [Steccherinum ochraceum]|uniref:Uncharacterized protein n=1 Tax=Steccherinum ochraceum TaxID=92696 RepID=A0A4V2MUV3_9APHY|nr:hypothetical protein EIP91_011008 [Steccherinum ochraceum]